MITFSTLFILLYVYSTYKIKVESGSWSKFQLLKAPNAIIFFTWILGTVVIFASIIAFIIYLVISDIIP
jgi:hypothetical protein